MLIRMQTKEHSLFSLVSASNGGMQNIPALEKKKEKYKLCFYKAKKANDCGIIRSNKAVWKSFLVTFDYIADGIKARRKLDGLIDEFHFSLSVFLRLEHIRHSFYGVESIETIPLENVTRTSSRYGH